jgi:hypothetical protein
MKEKHKLQELKNSTCQKNTLREGMQFGILHIQKPYHSYRLSNLILLSGWFHGAELFLVCWLWLTWSGIFPPYRKPKGLLSSWQEFPNGPYTGYHESRSQVHKKFPYYKLYNLHYRIIQVVLIIKLENVE